jgi:hypothetical protein
MLSARARFGDPIRGTASVTLPERTEQNHLGDLTE